MAIDAGLRAAVEAWIADDPDSTDQEELRGLVARDAGEELRDRFAGRLTFGTAGLRGAMGAGPNRMNRAVVRAATAAVAGWLLDARGTVRGAGWEAASARRSRSWWGVTRGTGRMSSRMRWRGCWPGPASGCTCCRGRGRRRCSRSPCGTWVPGRA